MAEAECLVARSGRQKRQKAGSSVNLCHQASNGGRFKTDFFIFILLKGHSTLFFKFLQNSKQSNDGRYGKYTMSILKCSCHVTIICNTSEYVCVYVCIATVYDL